MPHGAKTTPWIKGTGFIMNIYKIFKKWGDVGSQHMYQISCGFEFGTAPNCRREQA
jgi:hypothetical protein